GIQAWVALPQEHEETPPSFHHHQGTDELPEFDEDGVTGRLIAGSIDGLNASVHTHSPLFYLHWDMADGARRTLGTEYSERAVYVARGAIDLDGHVVTEGQMLVLEPGRAAQIQARGLT